MIDFEHHSSSVSKCCSLTFVVLFVYCFQQSIRIGFDDELSISCDTWQHSIMPFEFNTNNVDRWKSLNGIDVVRDIRWIGRETPIINRKSENYRLVCQLTSQSFYLLMWTNNDRTKTTCGWRDLHVEIIVDHVEFKLFSRFAHVE
jgi:hypothetical protein